MSREDALKLYTQGSSWFSGESGKKGTIAKGQFADMALLSDDYLECPEERIRAIESVLTVTAGKVVFAQGDVAEHCPPLPPVSPSWSPVGKYGGCHHVDSSAPVVAHQHTTIFSPWWPRRKG
jgi:hypothetical protein